MHRTGTTSIQKFAAANRARLRELGLYYPQLKSRVGPTNPGHHHFAHALSDEKSPSVSHQAAMDFIETVRTTAGRDTVLLSAEPLCRHVLGQDTAVDYWAAKSNYIAAVKDALAGFDVTIVVVFRRLDGFIQSLYKESVLKSSYKKDIKSFIEERNKLFQYTRQIDAWETAFGRDNMVIGLYDDTRRGRDSLDAFFGLLGYDTTGIEDRATGESNVSLPSTVVELKRQLNENNLKGRQSLKLRHVLQHLYDDEDFIDLVGRGYATVHVPFDESGKWRAEMESLVERLSDPVIGRAAMTGWQSHLEQGVVTDPQMSATLVSTLTLAAQAHFKIAAGIHKSYADEHDRRGNRDHSAKSLGRALEFTPDDADLYKAMLSRIPQNDAAERDNILLNASKDLPEDLYRDLLRWVETETNQKPPPRA